MRTPWAWLAEYRLVRREMAEDAAAYSLILADIEELASWCADIPEVEATAVWLLRNDLLRRWKPGDDQVPPGRYWGPVETFREQMIVGRKQRRGR